MWQSCSFGKLSSKGPKRTQKFFGEIFWFCHKFFFFGWLVLDPGSLLGQMHNFVTWFRCILGHPIGQCCPEKIAEPRLLLLQNVVPQGPYGVTLMNQTMNFHERWWELTHEFHQLHMNFHETSRKVTICYKVGPEVHAVIGCVVLTSWTFTNIHELPSTISPG